MAETYMITLAENLNVSNKKIWTGLKEKDPKPIREMVEKIVAVEPDRIDINLARFARTARP